MARRIAEWSRDLVGMGLPRLLFPPAPERDHVVRMRTHLTIPVFLMRRERSLARRIAEWSQGFVWSPVYCCLFLLLRETM